jgi:hypothetical protein
MALFRNATGGIRPTVAFSFAGVAIVAVAATALAVGVGASPAPGSIARPSASTVPSAPPPSAPPIATPVATAVPTQKPSEPTPKPTHTNSPTDPAPIKVDLKTVDRSDVRVDVVDISGILESAVSGSPAEGASAEGLVVENVDARTLRLTWVDFPIDNIDQLNIEWFDGHLKLVLVQPEPRIDSDSVGYDRELVLAFSEPVSAADVEGLVTTGLDTPG